MTRQEARTDFWVGKLLEDEGIPYTPQGTDNDEIAQALKTASKRGTGNAGFPEFVSVIKDYVLVIEDKADTAKHALLAKDDVLDDSTKAVSDYAMHNYGSHRRRCRKSTQKLASPIPLVAQGSTNPSSLCAMEQSWQP